MTEVTFKSNYGSFAYEAAAKIEPEVFITTPFIDSLSTEHEKSLAAQVEQAFRAWATLGTQGLANICYRVIGSNVDKALGVKAKKDGGTGRDGVPYTAANISIIQAAVAEKLEEMAEELHGIAVQFRITGEHFKGESTQPSKEAKAQWLAIQGLPAEKFAKMAKVLDLPDDYTDEIGERCVHRWILAQKRKDEEAAKARRAAELARLMEVE